MRLLVPMRIRGLLIAGATFVALASLYAVDKVARAQPLFPTSLNGLETWVAAIGGPQGTSIFVNTSMMRNAGAITTISGAGAHTTVMTTQQSTLVWTGAAPTTWTVTLPAKPFDGQRVQLASATTLTLVTVNPASGNQLAALHTQALDAGSSHVFQFAASTNTWYRIQ